jgi:hypothetical protein
MPESSLSAQAVVLTVALQQTGRVATPGLICEGQALRSWGGQRLDRPLFRSSNDGDHAEADRPSAWPDR